MSDGEDQRQGSQVSRGTVSVATLDDAALLAAASRQDHGAFAEIIARYHTPVYRLVWRMLKGHAEAEDVAQEAFIKLWQNPAQLRDPKALKGWLMRVASNRALDWLRKKPAVDLESVGEITDNREDALLTLERAQVNNRIDEALGRLPERQRLAITLNYFEGQSNISAAEIMEVTVDAFESLLARARRNLKQDLAVEWQELLRSVNHEA